MPVFAGSKQWTGCDIRHWNSYQEISRAGFELDEFYEDEAPEDEADYEPEDDYEEDCDEEL